MLNNNAGTPIDIESNQAMSDKAPDGKPMNIDIESKQDMVLMSDKGPDGKPRNTDIESKHGMVPKGRQANVKLFLDQLQVYVTGTIVVMIRRKWDVSAVTGRYLSTDFVVSLSTQFDGSTKIRKDFVKPEGFVRYPFELVDFDSIQPTNKMLLATSQNSSTMIFDDPEIPALKTLRLYENIGVNSKYPSLPADLSQLMGAFDVVVAPRGALGLKGAPKGCVGFVRIANIGRNAARECLGVGLAAVGAFGLAELAQGCVWDSRITIRVRLGLTETPRGCLVLSEAPRGCVWFSKTAKRGVWLAV
ncbi:hypothetical protein Tco_0698313 [Tanacetum coccineum]